MLARAGLSYPEIGARVGVSSSLIGHWCTGRRRPLKVEHRVKLRDEFGIPVEMWDEPAEASSGPGLAKTAPASTPTAPTSLGAWDESMRQKAAWLDQRIRAACDEIEAKGDPTFTIRNGSTITSMMSLLAKLSGETQVVSEARILRLPAWRRIQDAIHVALKPWPEAMLEVGKILEKIAS